MNLGILMSFLNQRYFHDRLSMICEFIPQMIFLNAMFGYLCFLILLKWATGSTADLYHTLIYMFLSVSPRAWGMLLLLSPSQRASNVIPYPQRSTCTD